MALLLPQPQSYTWLTACHNSWCRGVYNPPLGNLFADNMLQRLALTTVAWHPALVLLLCQLQSAPFADSMLRNLVLLLQP